MASRRAPSSSYSISARRARRGAGDVLRAAGRSRGRGRARRPDGRPGDHRGAGRRSFRSRTKPRTAVRRSSTSEMLRPRSMSAAIEPSACQIERRVAPAAEQGVEERRAQAEVLHPRGVGRRTLPRSTRGSAPRTIHARSGETLLALPGVPSPPGWRRSERALFTTSPAGSAPWVRSRSASTRACRTSGRCSSTSPATRSAGGAGASRPPHARAHVARGGGRERRVHEIEGRPRCPPARLPASPPRGPRGPGHRAARRARGAGPRASGRVPARPSGRRTRRPSPGR